MIFPPANNAGVNAMGVLNISHNGVSWRVGMSSMVTRVVADDELAAEVATAARRIAHGAPLSNRWHKKFARRLTNPRKLSTREYAEGFANCATEDYREGYRAFLAGRKPKFAGR